MKKVLTVLVVMVTALSVAGCMAGKGKAPIGKGKAPTVVTKG